MTDLLKRLRAAKYSRGPLGEMSAHAAGMMHEAADEIERLRAALDETRVNLELVERLRIKDPAYGAEVEALGERIGYGALMSSAQASWRASNARRGFPTGGEFVAGPCYATVMKNLEMVRAALNPDSTPKP